MDKFIIKENKTSMQWMLDQQMYKLKIHYSTTAQSHMDWVGNQIQYKNKKFNMDQLQGMMHGLVGKCRRMLMKKVIKVNKTEKKEKRKLPAILWAKLKNNPNCEKMGHNFIQNKHNPWPMDNKK